MRTGGLGLSPVAVCGGGEYGGGVSENWGARLICRKR